AAHLVREGHERVVRAVVHRPVEQDGPGAFGGFRSRADKRARRHCQDTGEDKAGHERNPARFHGNRLLNGAVGVRRLSAIGSLGGPMNVEPERCGGAPAWWETQTSSRNQRERAGRGRAGAGEVRQARERCAAKRSACQKEWSHAHSPWQALTDAVALGFGGLSWWCEVPLANCKIRAPMPKSTHAPGSGAGYFPYSSRMALYTFLAAS